MTAVRYRWSGIISGLNEVGIQDGFFSPRPGTAVFLVLSSSLGLSKWLGLLISWWWAQDSRAPYMVLDFQEKRIKTAGPVEGFALNWHSVTLATFRC